MTVLLDYYDQKLPFYVIFLDNLEAPSDPEKEEKNEIILESYIKKIYDKRAVLPD